MKPRSYEPKALVDLELLERTLITAHRICAEGFESPSLSNSDLRNWFYSWCFVLERLIGEAAAQKKKLK